jgi:FMN phosphatase YigB (HAD superfamily)
MTKFVIWDIGNVLAVDFYVAFLEDMVRDEVLSNYSEIELESIMKDVTLSASNAMNDFKLGLIPEDEFFSRVIRENEHLKNSLFQIGYSEAEATQMFKTSLRRSYFKLYSNVVGVAEHVKNKGHSIGILSNHVREWSSELFEKVEDGMLKRVFDDPRSVVLSCDQTVQTYKPKKEVYKVLMHRLRSIDSNLVVEQVLFIDDKQRNVSAATEFGLKSFVFDARHDSISLLLQKLHENGVDVSSFSVV